MAPPQIAAAATMATMMNGTKRVISSARKRESSARNGIREMRRLGRSPRVLAVACDPAAALRQTSAGTALGQRDVSRVEGAIGGDIVAEIRSRDRVTALRLDHTNVESIDHAIGIY